MAVTGFSLSERFSRWQVLANNLKESQRSNPVVTDKLADLEALLAEARALLDQQAQFRAQSQQITKQLVEIARRGDRVRSRLGAFLQSEIGFTNEELIRYGFRPVRPPVRRRVVVVQAPAATSTESTESAATTSQPAPGASRA